MQISVIQIGNSKGIRLSKTILDKYEITDKLEILLESGQIILRPVHEPRKGWAKKFKAMREQNDDALLMDDVFEEEDFEAWK